MKDMLQLLQLRKEEEQIENKIGSIIGCGHFSIIKLNKIKQIIFGSILRDGHFSIIK